MDAYTDLAVQRSLLYKEAHTHGRKSKEVVVTFDWKNVKARYAKSGKKKRPIDIAPGTFDTYLIEPNLKDVGGVFKKSRDAKIKLWITADHRKIPVRLKSKVIVGSFTGDLVSFQ